MSFEVAGLVLRARTGLGMGAKMVLLGLAEHAHPDGTEARPAVSTLARYAECSESTVLRHLKRLENGGYITGERRQGRPTVYAINLPTLGELTPVRSTDPRTVPAPEPQVDGPVPTTPIHTPRTLTGVADPKGPLADRQTPPVRSTDEPVLQPALNPSTDPKARPASTNPNPNQPTHDQMYLAHRIDEKYEGTGRLTPAAIVKLNKGYGVGAVTSAMRTLYQFDPAEPLASAYAYVESLCQMGAAS